MIESHRQEVGKTWGEMLDSERARRHLLPPSAPRWLTWEPPQ